MPTSPSLVSLLEQVPGVSAIDATTDRVDWVSSSVIRCIYDGRRAVAVGTDAKTQINGLLDLVELHLEHGSRVGGTRVAPDEVVLLLAEDDEDGEAEGALRTLAARWRGPFAITLRRLTSRGEVLPIRAGALEDLGDPEEYRYTEWLRFLTDVGDRPPALVERIMAGVPCEAFRAYPMLSRKNWWSLRLEGLEVAQVGPTTGRIAVGRDTEGRVPGPERTTWLNVVPDGRLTVTDDDASVARAVEAINDFADAWAKELAGTDTHDEHAFESRVLRGIVPIRTSQGELDLLRMPDDGRVSWGSQFPTRWGSAGAGRARYLDALLRAGSTPWALELKAGPSVASYYRHAVSQAVLYREFIRRATHLGPWFAQFGLDQTACRAAVVVPEFKSEHGIWRDRLHRLCVAFDVELVPVPERFARAELRPV